MFHQMKYSRVFVEPDVDVVDVICVGESSREPDRSEWTPQLRGTEPSPQVSQFQDEGPSRAGRMSPSRPLSPVHFIPEGGEDL